MSQSRGPRISWFFALVLCAAAFPACGSDYRKPRHVVLIVVDTLRADHLSTYGYRRPTSPELDKLAAEGAVFEHAVSQCSWTQPSMVSMMTGAYLADELREIPESKTTLASVFQKEGFATAAFIYNNVLNDKNGFQRGFDVFDFEDPPYQPITKISDWITANKGKQTFTFIHLNEAHDPYETPDEFDHFVKEKDSLTSSRLDWYREVSKQHGLGAFEENVRQINEKIGGYDDDVRYSDDHIGKILSAIRASGEWEQTAIVIAADHGEGLWTRFDYMTGPRLKSKQAGQPPTLLNSLKMDHGNQVGFELVHVPLIFVAPGMPKGVRVQPWVENVDIGPTLLELCDLPRPANMQGSSLLPLWSQPEVVAHQKRGSFTHTRYVSSFIDQNGFQLIQPTPRGECEFDLEVELYDLNKDPEARVNLAASEKSRVEGMSKDIAARMKLGMTQAEIAHGESEDERARLNLIGYVDREMVDLVDKKYAAMTTEQLLEALADPKIANCLERIRAALALKARALTPDEKSAVKALRVREVSAAIRTVFDETLAKE
ncbi:MAG TPA: sulfatase [Planctomycetota bacterium]|nr:sulfatase [Planctomycetota bacterium]